MGSYLQVWIERIAPPHGAVKLSTWRSYDKHVRIHLATDPIAERRVGDLQKLDAEDVFRRLLDKGLSPATVQSVRRTLRVALNVHPKLQTNVAKDAAGPRVPRHALAKDELWTEVQARTFLASASEADPDMTTLVRLALDSGARIGELLGLRWADLTDQTITIRRTVAADDGPVLRFDSTKSDKERRVDIDASTVAALQEMRDRQHAEPVADLGDLIFRRPTARGFQPLRPDPTTHLPTPLEGRRGAGRAVPPPSPRLRLMADRGGHRRGRGVGAAGPLVAGLHLAGVLARHAGPPGRAGPYHRGGAWLVFLHGSDMRLPAGTAWIAFPQVGAHRGR